MDPDRPGWSDDAPHGAPAEDEHGPPPAPPGPLSGSLLDPTIGASHLGASVARVPRRPADPAEGRRSMRRGLRALVLLLAASAGLVVGAVAAERLDLAVLGGDGAAIDGAEHAAMAALLEDVVRTEGVMLAFNDVVAERLDGALEEWEALASVALAAASGAGGLEALRPLIADRQDGPEVEEVRSVYLPHLDSWIEYLSAIADDPALLFDREGQQLYILRINATADAFRIALEHVIADAPSSRAADLADRILDDGFRTDGPEPMV